MIERIGGSKSGEGQCKLYAQRGRTGRVTYVLGTDGLDNILWGSTEKFSDDRELVDVILSREEWSSLEHLSKDTSS